MPPPSTLSARGRDVVDKPLRADFARFHEAEQDAYHPDDNPAGAIALCIAENVLCWPELRARLAELAARSPIPGWVAKYTDVRGAPALREALSGFAGRHIATLGVGGALTLDAEGIAVSSGATAIVELTAWCLGDPGDVAVFPAPCYPVYRQDVGHKAALERFDLQPAGSFKEGIHPLTTDDLERAREELEGRGQRFRMLVLTQPDNPTGAIYAQQQLEAIADWCVAHEVHCCVNELYALSQVDHTDPRLAADYGDAPPPYHSFLHVIEARGRSPYLHWWYSFSKDFGISGLRCGALYSRNADLLQAIGNLGAPHTVSNHTQWLLAGLLADDAWLTAYAKTNRARLTDAYVDVIQVLRKRGIAYAPARGSLFVWVRSGEDAQATWDALYTRHRVLLTAPGGFGQKEDGWLRLVYTAVERETLKVALGRVSELF